MTVEELLQLPTIKGLKLISGNLGVHREISTVTVVDTPDGFQWLKGNEVVITTTYALEKTPNAFLDFISKLLSRNISVSTLSIKSRNLDILCFFLTVLTGHIRILTPISTKQRSNMPVS